MENGGDVDEESALQKKLKIPGEIKLAYTKQIFRKELQTNSTYKDWL